MRLKTPFVLVVCLIAALLLPLTVLAQDEGPAFGRDSVFEQEIHDRLAAIDPDAVSVFEQATVDMDAGRFDAAEAGYLEVLELAPDFPDALRRLSYVEAQLGRVDAAMTHAKLAYEIDPSSANAAAVAQILLESGTPRDNTEALRLARDAHVQDPDDPFNAAVLAMAGLANEDTLALQEGASTLLRVAPNDPSGHLFSGILEAEAGHWIKAENELKLARDLGAPAELIDPMLVEGGIAQQAQQARLLRGAGYAVGGWIASMGVLFVLGAILSAATMATVRRLRPGETFQPTPIERVVRAIYRVVIFFASLYYYISIPFLLILTIALAGGLIYLFVSLGRVPIKLLLIVIAGALFTVGAVIRSLFTRRRQGDPGPKLSREDAPALWAMLEDVAARIGTRPVDSVFITPLADIGVSERGSMPARLLGRGERVLVLGMAALPGMTQAAFKAVLAHEYGHFSNRDTAGGNLALHVRMSMHEMAYGLATKGQASWLNPVWLFLNGYLRVFLRITLGASRLQEILADRYAAMAYGARNLKDALEHLVRQTMRFNAQASAEVRAALQQRRQPANLYALPAIEDNHLQLDIEKRVQEELKRPTSAYDSHPAMSDRFALLSALEMSTPHDSDSRPALDVLKDPVGWQEKMSRLLFENVVRQAR